MILNVFIIKFIPYTEIDWETYMKHISIYKKGIYNYTKLEGPTGPCVYPAGFVYIYSTMYSITNKGKNLKMAQYIFSMIYIFNLMLVLNIYRKSKRVPIYFLILISITSYRVHSIYVLRMFNDTLSILLLHIGLNFLLYQRYTLSSIFLSLALSVKMNILLYFPAYGIILVLSKGIEYGILQAFLMLFIQVILGLSFLLESAPAYLNRAFQLGRQFDYKWTVNWRFVSPVLFSSRGFHVALLALHLTFLTYFICGVWIRKCNLSIWSMLYRRVSSIKMDANDIMSCMFISNFLGVMFARSLHYQFYVWYYYSIPFLLWTAYPPGHPFYKLFGRTNFKLLIWGLIEYCWNVYPSTVVSSLTLNACHCVILIGLLYPLLNLKKEKTKIAKLN
ncbi:unnamed protein product [Gordionus sp. m RMFG-2023]|uniref:lethal(2)neighbour of Tid protein-like isoform X1 n=1 Tax=Gordionus sp. m RMFG-2023 TaxID=3053472 RepID=UPI0030E4F0A3